VLPYSSPLQKYFLVLLLLFTCFFFLFAWWGTGKNPVDLDASCVLVDIYANVLDAVFYNKLSADNGSVVHSGDSKDGKGENRRKNNSSKPLTFFLSFSESGDDEVIRMNLQNIPPTVQALIFSINCKDKYPFQSGRIFAH
jgi:tellurium resistance protein TerZ